MSSSVPVSGITRVATKCPGLIFKDDHTLSRGPCVDCLLKARQIAEREAEYKQQQNRRSEAKKTLTPAEYKQQQNQKSEAKKNLKAAKSAWKATDPTKASTKKVAKDTARKTPKKTRGAVEKKTPKRTTKDMTDQAAAEVLVNMSHYQHQK
ncbi:hypothetical protein J4E81_004928 [Alternaria sp. BMP 2799]|nr:hypothetical protein J4E81_004928 [Alternaria sp. BMP 2799]